MLENYWNDVKHWAAHPYREDGTVIRLGFVRRHLGCRNDALG
jgi:hypothetical protein